MEGFSQGNRFWLLQTSSSDKDLLDPKAKKNRNHKLQTGDVLLIYHDNGNGEGIYLDHMVTYIEDLYLERSGSGDRVPFRLNTWAGITQTFPAIAFTWEWRRRNSDIGVLEAAAEMFVLHLHISYFPLLA
jgi:hypothetical protein